MSNPNLHKPLPPRSRNLRKLKSSIIPPRPPIKRKRFRKGPKIPKAPPIPDYLEKIGESEENSELDIPPEIIELMNKIFKKKEDIKAKDMRFRCELCKKPTLQKCSGCYNSYYCCEEHQTLHWPVHKVSCIKKRRGAVMSNNSGKILFLLSILIFEIFKEIFF